MLAVKPLRVPPSDFEFRCTCYNEALSHHIAQAMETGKLVEDCWKEPMDVIKRLALISQRDRDADAYSKYIRARKLLLHATKLKAVAARQ